MTAQFQISQVGLDAGAPGLSRTDGLADGSLVICTNTGAGATTLFRLLWTPPGDSTAVSTLGATVDPKVWTFEPTPNCYGTYLVELVENEGLSTEKTERRALVVRTPNLGLVIPAFGERADRNASLVLDGAAQVEAADNNADDYADAELNARRYAGWWRSMHELAIALDTLELTPGPEGPEGPEGPPGPEGPAGGGAGVIRDTFLGGAAPSSSSPINASSTTANIGDLGWSFFEFSGNGTCYCDQPASDPCIGAVRITAGAGSSSMAGILLGRSGIAQALLSKLRYRVAGGTGGVNDEGEMWCTISGASSFNVETEEYAGFFYDRSGTLGSGPAGNWHSYTSNGAGVAVSKDTGVAALVGEFQDLMVERISATEWRFHIAGVLVTTHSTALGDGASMPPTGLVYAKIRTEGAATSSHFAHVDDFQLEPVE